MIDSRKRRAAQRDGTVDSGGGDPASASLFEEGKVRGSKAKGTPAKSNPNKLTVTQLRELETQKEREGVQSWHRVQELYARMLAGEEEATREWLVEAEKLVESFRETRALFLTSRVRSIVCDVGSVRVDEVCSIADSAGCFRGARESRLRRRARIVWRRGCNSNLVSPLYSCGLYTYL